MSKKILFISYDGMTDPLGQSQVIPYLSNLSKYGYEFTIISCDKPGKYDDNKAYVEKLIAPFPIKWVSIPYHKSPPVLSSVYDFIQLRKKVKQLHEQEKFDLVHTRVGLPTLTAMWLKKRYKIKFLNDIRGFWADERIDGGMWNLKNPLYRLIYDFFKDHELECIIQAEYNTCLTYAAQREIHSWKDVPNQPIPIEVIPCSADLELFDPGKVNGTLKEQFKKELNITDNDFIISYLGSIGGWYLTKEMMLFCKQLSDRVPAARFLFISPSGHDMIVEAAAACGLSQDKLIIKEGKRHEVPVLLSFSRYSLFFIKPCYSKISSSPTKHGEIMAMGIPVITNDGVGDVAEIVTRYNAGYVLKDFSTDSFSQVIDQITAGYTFDPVAIRNGAKDFYALDMAVERYLKVYRAVMG